MFLLLTETPMSQQCSNMLHVMMQEMYIALHESADACFCIQLM